MNRLKIFNIPLIFVAVHTGLLLLTVVAAIASTGSHNADTNIGCFMAVLAMLIDFPITLLRESLRAQGYDGVFVILGLYFGLANAMWFVVGLLLQYFIPLGNQYLLAPVIRLLKRYWQPQLSVDFPRSGWEHICVTIPLHPWFPPTALGALRASVMSYQVKYGENNSR